MKKKGWIKYADPDKGYGYILAEDAESPRQTMLFDVGDIMESSPGSVLPGAEVEFDEVADDEGRLHAKQIRVTRVA